MLPRRLEALRKQAQFANLPVGTFVERKLLLPRQGPDGQSRVRQLLYGRRKLVGAAAALIALIALLTAASWRWPAPGVEAGNLVAGQMLRAGVTAEIQGRAFVSLLPRPRLILEGVRMHDSGGGAELVAEEFRGDLRVGPLFAGRMELASATLVRAKISIDLDAIPYPAAAGLAHTLLEAPGSATGARPGGIALQAGALRLHSASRHFDIAVEDMNVAIEWRQPNSAAGVTGMFVVDGQKSQIAVWIGAPAAFLKGGNTGVSLQLDSVPLSLAMNGTLTGGRFVSYDGKISATAPALRRLAGAGLGVLPLPGPLEGFAVSGNARLRAGDAALDEARLHVDGNDYEGAMALDWSGERSMFSATLAAGNLNMQPFFVAAPLLGAANGQWLRARLPTPVLAPFDVDMRLSVAHGRLGRIDIADAGISFAVKKGSAEVDVQEAAMFKGLIRARFSARRSADGYDVTATGALKNGDGALVMNDLFLSQRLSGALAGDFDIASAGDTWGRILRGLRGAAHVTLRDGEVSGIDFEQALRRLEKRPLAMASEIRGGRTALSQANLDIAFDNGIATLQRGDATGPGVKLNVAGSVDVPGRSLDLKLVAGQAGIEASESSTAPQLSLDLRGDWDQPVRSFDARSLIRRSPAAEPLLRSLTPDTGVAPASPPREVR